MTTGTANRSLMVIDDDPDIRGMLQHLFRERGYDVTTASDGEEGLRLSNERRPDLIILDIFMPRMSGLEVLASLKRSQPGVPVIVVSAGGERTPSTRRRSRCSPACARAWAGSSTSRST